MADRRANLFRAMAHRVDLPHGDRRSRWWVVCAVALGMTVSAGAQTPSASTGSDSPYHEFRSTWIATVANLDWPARGASSESQQAALTGMLDGLKAAGLNAVFFQIRTESDAFYDSSLEPWSYWLTGLQGVAPVPAYDPLALAIEEAHRRGIELHAWFNPFRAERVTGAYALAPTHVVNRHPEWLLDVPGISWLDPGVPAVRDYVASVIADVVRRYDVDGVHFDDYFYPYPPKQITDEDEETFAADPRGFTADQMADWRRDNINRFVAQVADSIRSIKPHVKYGISPFGIYRNGVPSGITGLDAYNVIFSDPLAWVDGETVDYVVPQLYWPFGGGQDYSSLALWWASVMWYRHLYIGHGLYRSDPETFSGTLFAPTEVPRQVRLNRTVPEIQGSAFFRAANLTRLHSQGFADSLQANLYAAPAIPPIMPWKDMQAPPPPGELTVSREGSEVVLRWKEPETGTPSAWFRYVVFRVRSAEEPDVASMVGPAGQLVALTGETTWIDEPPASDLPIWYAVETLSSNSVESAPVGPVGVEGRPVALEGPALPTAGDRLEAYPNPFGGALTLSVEIGTPQTISLTIYDVLGRPVRRLIDQQAAVPGRQELRWDGTDRAGGVLPAGAYLVVLQTDSGRLTRSVLYVP